MSIPTIPTAEKVVKKTKMGGPLGRGVKMEAVQK